MSLLAKPGCVALGCKNASLKKSPFCMPHWRELPELLRAEGPEVVRRARTFLAKKDGYLVDMAIKSPKLTDVKGTGSEYV